MGPKKKGTKRARASTGMEMVVAGDTSNPPPSASKNKKKGKGKSNSTPNIVKKSLVLPSVILTAFPRLNGLRVARCVSYQKWDKFFELNLVACSKLIKDFYNHYSVDYSSSIVKWSYDDDDRNVVREYTSVDFENDFGIACEGSESVVDGSYLTPDAEAFMRKVIKFNNGETEYDDANRKCLDGDDYLLLKLVRLGVVPTNNKSLTPSKCELEVFLNLKDNVLINLPKLIAFHMEESRKAKFKSLPYGIFVTFLMIKWGFERGSEKEKVQGVKFDSLGLSRYGLELERLGPERMRVLYKNARGPVEEEGDREEDGGEAEESSKASRQRKGKGKMDASSATVQEDVASLRNEVRSGLKVVRKNQGLLAKGLNAIMRAIVCQSKGKKVKEDSLKEIILDDLEDFEEHGDDDENEDGSNNNGDDSTSE